MNKNRCKVPKIEPCGTPDVSFYDLLVFEVQGLEGFTKVLSKQFSSILQQILVKYSIVQGTCTAQKIKFFIKDFFSKEEQRHKNHVILDSYFQLYDRILGVPW